MAKAVRKIRQQEVIANVTTISPTEAQAMLDNSVHNRPVNKRQMLGLVKVIQGGEWVLNGESIILSDRGRLLDGQHRLLACVRTGVAIESVVVTGVDEAAFDRLDLGVKRTLSQLLRMQGEKDYLQLAGAVDLLTRMVGNYGFVGTPYIQLHEHLSILESNPGIRDSLAVCYPVLLSTGGNSFFVLCHYLACENGLQVAADKFSDQVQTGARLEANHPALHLRNRYLQNKYQKVRKVTRLVMGAMTIKAWNAAMANESIRILRFSVNQHEQFPEIEFT